MLSCSSLSSIGYDRKKNIFRKSFATYPYHFCFWKLILRPDTFSKKSNSLRITSSVRGKPSEMRDVSSVYWDNLNYTSLILICFMFYYSELQFQQFLHRGERDRAIQDLHVCSLFEGICSLSEVCSEKHMALSL